MTLSLHQRVQVVGKPALAGEIVEILPVPPGEEPVYAMVKFDTVEGPAGCPLAKLEPETV